MLGQRTSVGLDVHARSVVACGLDRETGAVVEQSFRRYHPFAVHRRTPLRGGCELERGLGSVSHRRSNRRVPHSDAA